MDRGRSFIHSHPIIAAINGVADKISRVDATVV